MHTHILQLDITWEDKQANYATVREMIEGAPIATGDLIVLPELFDVGFTLNTKIACDTDNSTLTFLQELADATQCTIHGSRAIKSPDPDKAYNCATICKPNQSSPACEYYKVHPFSFGREADSYLGGDRITQYRWTAGEQSLSICPAVCYDLRFPELFRLGAKRGAQAFVFGASWPIARMHHWRSLSIARAIENQAFVIAANRTGNDPYLQYNGGSLVINPKGEVLGELNDEQAVLSVEIDPQIAVDWRSTFPALNDIKLV